MGDGDSSNEPGQRTGAGFSPAALGARIDPKYNFSQLLSNFENCGRKYQGSKPNKADQKGGKKSRAKFALGLGGDALFQAPIFLRF